MSGYINQVSGYMVTIECNTGTVGPWISMQNLVRQAPLTQTIKHAHIHEKLFWLHHDLVIIYRNMTAIEYVQTPERPLQLFTDISKIIREPVFISSAHNITTTPTIFQKTRGEFAFSMLRSMNIIQDLRRTDGYNGFIANGGSLRAGNGDRMTWVSIMQLTNFVRPATTRCFPDSSALIKASDNNIEGPIIPTLSMMPDYLIDLPLEPHINTNIIKNFIDIPHASGSMAASALRTHSHHTAVLGVIIVAFHHGNTLFIIYNWHNNDLDGERYHVTLLDDALSNIRERGVQWVDFSCYSVRQE